MIFSKVGLVSTILATFSILTGWVVLAGADQTVNLLDQEKCIARRSARPRTNQIMKITLIEYTYLG